MPVLAIHSEFIMAISSVGAAQRLRFM